MAYVPPHRRHSKESERPLPTPELLAPQFKKNLNDKQYNKSNVDWNGKIVYADNSTHRWCAIPLDDENQFPSFVNLEPVALESAEQIIGKNRVALINTSLNNEGSEVKWNLPRSPWESITENVLEDLLSAFKDMRNEMTSAKRKEVYPTLVARVGKVLFRRSPSVNGASIRKELCPEILKQWRRSFYINTPVSYKEKIVNEVVPKIGVDFEDEEDTYEVQLSDSTKPDLPFSCKCRVMEEHGKLQPYKIKLIPVRNMVMDISCTTKNLDLRLMLCTKKLVTDLTIYNGTIMWVNHTGSLAELMLLAMKVRDRIELLLFQDDEMQSITDLINSAILDPNVKGGLRWSLGKESSGDRYKVVRVWHVIANTYRNSSLTLKVKHTDRFDFRTLTGEASWWTSLVLENVVSKLQEENVEASTISEILKKDMQLIWENFLSCEPFLT